MKQIRSICLCALALMTFGPAVSASAASPGEPGQIRIEWKRGAAGTWSTGSWSPTFAAAWDTLLHTGLSTAQAAGDTFYVRMKLRDAAGNESRWFTADDFPGLARSFVRQPAAPTLTVVDCYCASDHAYLSVGSDVPAQFCYATRLAVNEGCTLGGSWSAYSSWTSTYSTTYAMNGPAGTPLHYACIKIKARDARGNESAVVLCSKYFDSDTMCQD